MLKLSVAVLLLVGLAHSAPTVSNALLNTLKAQGTANIYIRLNHGSGIETLKTIEHNVYATIADRRNNVVNTLKVSAEKNFAEIREFIANEKSADAQVHHFWITNKIIIRSADLQLVEKLMNRKDIQEIREERAIPLVDPLDFVEGPRAGEQWGVVKVRAPEVWNAMPGYNGAGVVVANIDTGVRGTHEALAGNHRQQDGWMDPEGGTSSPTDNGGHGTHTMGSIAGTTQGIGVAPGAQWIACKGCGTSSCSEFALLTCAEWVSCPSGGNCATAPDVVSNSWGGGQNDDWYDDSIAAWRAENIVPLFSQGNSGPSCGSANSPGDSVLAIGVGSTTSSDTVSSFSSVGPTVGGRRIKPDISAPGSNVYSSYNTGNAAYATMSGTSMASPHAAGVAALILQANNALTVDQVKSALERGAVHTTSTGANCGNISEDVHPNHHVGWGRIDAVNSVALAKKM